jgi:8-oxo-dGTP pyrophosphatase MutT (NUDIX family)
VIKEAAASTFVFREDPGGVWRTALVWHPRLECWMPSGGHVERDESAAEAALREAREETGLEVHLPSGPAVAVPAGFPLLRVLWGSPPRRTTLRQMPGGELLQHVSVGVVLVVAAALTPAVSGQAASRNTCGVTTRF